MMMMMILLAEFSSIQWVACTDKPICTAVDLGITSSSLRALKIVIALLVFTVQ